MFDYKLYIMKYLTPEIAALTKVKPSKTLFKRNVSCGIFQDLGEEANEHAKSEAASEKNN